MLIELMRLSIFKTEHQKYGYDLRNFSVFPERLQLHTVSKYIRKQKAKY